MAPFTTYIIPESSNKETAITGKWLWIILDKPVSSQNQELLQKICEALKADFHRDTHIIIYDRTEPISISTLGAANASMVISFGVQPSALGLWIDLDKPGISYLESFWFILTVGLEELSIQPSSKKLLWSSMQSFLHSRNHV